MAWQKGNTSGVKECKTTNLCSGVKFNEKFGAFKAEFAYLRPTKVIQLCHALVEKNACMGNAQIEMDSSIFLKSEYVLKNIRVKE